MKFEWENIFSTRDQVQADATFRAKVKGGWIILSKNSGAVVDGNDNLSTTCSQSMVFVPDPNYEWEIEKD
jgi:hypothetical protein